MARQVELGTGTVRQPRHVKACSVPVGCVGERHGEAVKARYGSMRFVGAS